jgi:thiamine biosynthesis lipoprotein
MSRFRGAFALILAAAALAALAVLAYGRVVAGTKEELGKFSTEFFGTFDTIVTFTAFAKDEGDFERYAGVVRGEMSRLHELFDIYNDYEGLNNVKTINDLAGLAPVEVDSSILELLEFGIDAYDKTDGTVDIALGPVLLIWHDYRERALAEGGAAAVPSIEELRASSSHISAEDIMIDRERSTVMLKYKDMRLDVGAIAKGYAVRSAVDRVRESGLESGIINAGGNVAVIGKPADGRDVWNIGVRMPEEGGTAKIADVIYLSDGAAVTSGNDQRYFIADGRRYHHIIDPKTLFPAEMVKAVTVTHQDSATADMLSTAAFILPAEKARALIGEYGAEALWLMMDGTKMATPGYIRSSRLGRSADLQ